MQVLAEYGSTIVVGLIVIVLAAFALRRVLKKGTCDCGSCSGGCPSCAAAEDLSRKIEQAAQDSDCACKNR